MTTQSVSSEITETPQVPVDIFVSQNPNHPVTKGYFTKQASVYVFDAVKQMLGHPSSNRLAKLLGIPNPHHIYHFVGYLKAIGICVLNLHVHRVSPKL